jgi:hypothetical protein
MRFLMAAFLLLLSASAFAGDEGFAYREIVVAQGSKSQGVRGELSYQGKPLAWKGRLVTPIGAFRYVPVKRLWETGGWLPEDAVQPRETSAPFDPALRARGSYEGPKRAGTPANWCFAPDLDVWYAPERLQ